MNPVARIRLDTNRACRKFTGFFGMSAYLKAATSHCKYPYGMAKSTFVIASFLWLDCIPVCAHPQQEETMPTKCGTTLRQPKELISSCDVSQCRNEYAAPINTMSGTIAPHPHWASLLSLGVVCVDCDEQTFVLNLSNPIGYGMYHITYNSTCIKTEHTLQTKC